MSQKKKTAPAAEPSRPVPNRAPSRPVRIPQDLLEAADEISALSSATPIQLTRTDVIVAAAKSGLDAIREQVTSFAAKTA